MKMSWERGGDFTLQPRRRTLALVKLPIYLFLLVVPLLLGYGVPRALADSFTFTTIDAPGGNKGSRASGLNIAGQIVGRFEPGGAEVAFRRDTDGSFTTIDVPGAMSSEANGINATGQIVGTFQDATGDHGFLRGTDASFTTIHVPGALGTAAAGINDTGQIAGTLYRR